MADVPYLIALALLEQNGTRAMPLQGKSLREPMAESGGPGEEGRRQVLELLVRVWQRSDTGSLQRAAADNSLLLAEVPIEALQLQLPELKANWLNSGDVEQLLRLDVARLQEQVDFELLPMYVLLEVSAPADSDLLAPVVSPDLSEGPHLSYAVQWLIFAVAVVVGWVLAVQRSRRAMRRKSSTTSGP